MEREEKSEPAMLRIRTARRTFSRATWGAVAVGFGWASTDAGYYARLDNDVAFSDGGCAAASRRAYERLGFWAENSGKTGSGIWTT